ncbi:hypothetical protein PspLS_05713 [Pyricularia sp. CBS 133598]|nr:hypothetical protein PspLS_05713 [Pyricularia sp. CBS 133598]
MLNPETSTRLLLLPCLIAALHASTTSAAARPSATGSVVIPPDAQSPRPTEAPVMLDLARRQNGITYLVAPDNSCGWLTTTDSAYTLVHISRTRKRKTIEEVGQDSRCVYWQPYGSYPERFDCCPAEGCMVASPRTSPVTHPVAPMSGYVDAFFGSFGRYPAYDCDSTIQNEPAVYVTTRFGIDRRFVVSTSLATIRTMITSNGVAVTMTVTESLTGPATVGTENANESGSGGNGQPSGGAGGGGGGGEQPSNGANTGAIVGGVVGGAAVLAVAALAAVLLYRRTKKSKSQLDGASSGPTGGGYYPMSPSQPDSTAFTSSPYNSPGISWSRHNAHSVPSASPAPTSPPNAPHYDGAYPKYPAPPAEVDGSGPNRVHEMATN